MEKHCGTCARFGDAEAARSTCVTCLNSNVHAMWEAPLPGAIYQVDPDTMAQQKANKRQIGGDHYTKLAIQPMQYSMANKLDACQHTVIKYVTRFRDKGGIQDLEKAKHVIDLLIEFEQSK